MSLQISAPCQLYRANGPVMWCTSLNRKVTSHQSPLTPQIKKHTFMSRSTDSIKQERLVLILPPLQQEDHVPRISACTSVCQRMSRPMMRPGPTREDTHTHTHTHTHTWPFHNPSGIYRASARGLGQLIYITTEAPSTAINTEITEGPATLILPPSR